MRRRNALMDRLKSGKDDISYVFDIENSRHCLSQSQKTDKRHRMKLSIFIIASAAIMLNLAAECSASPAMAEPPDAKQLDGRVKVNLSEVRRLFQPPHQFITDGSPVLRIIYAVQNALANECAMRSFSPEQLVKALNKKGLNRRELLQIRQIDFYIKAPARFKIEAAEDGIFSIVDPDERVINIPLEKLLSGSTPGLARFVILGAGCIEYYNAEEQEQEQRREWMKRYVQQCGQREARRYRLVHKFSDDISNRNLSSPRFKTELSDYLKIRQQELNTVIDSIAEWKKYFPEQLLTARRNQVLRLQDRIEAIAAKYRDNSTAALTAEDYNYLLRDINIASYGELSFFCINEPAILKSMAYDKIYAFCLDYFFSENMRFNGFSHPGYNTFHREFSAAKFQNNSDGPVSVSDFEIIFEDLSGPGSRKSNMIFAFD